MKYLSIGRTKKSRTLLSIWCSILSFLLSTGEEQDWNFSGESRKLEARQIYLAERNNYSKNLSTNKFHREISILMKYHIISQANQSQFWNRTEAKSFNFQDLMTKMRYWIVLLNFIRLHLVSHNSHRLEDLNLLCSKNIMQPPLYVPTYNFLPNYCC